MENFSINFLVKEIKNTFKFDTFLSKIKLKKDFLEFKLGKKVLCFPMRNRFAPFFAKNAGFESAEVKGPDINILRKYLEQSRLTNIEKPFEERVISFTFEKTMIWGDKKPFTFLVDAGAVPVKWYILDEDKKILYSKNDNTSIIGTKYVFPVDKRKSVFNCKENEIDNIENFREIIEKYKGFGPVYAKEIINSDNKKEFLEKLTKMQLNKGHKYKKDIFPFLLSSQKDKPEVYENMSEAIFSQLFSNINSERFINLKNRIKRKTENQLKKKSSLLKNLKKEFKDCENAKKYLLRGELLSANFHKIKKGMEKIVLIDYYTEKEVEIRLNPLISPEQNISKYYKTATKASKKKEFIEERLKNLKAEINSLNDKLYLLENAENLNELNEFIDEVDNNSKKTKKKQIAGLVRYNLPDNYIIYAGKTSDANHYIYTRKLTNNDLWFHAKDIPGSHVVLKCPNKGKVNKSFIEMAAEIAAYFSKERNNTIVEVQYTTKDNLYSSKGKGKGFVLLREFKTINVKPDIHQELTQN